MENYIESEYGNFLFYIVIFPARFALRSKASGHFEIYILTSVHISF